MTQRMLNGKRVLITHADQFMGPTFCEVFAAHGAEVIASTDLLSDAGAPAAVVAAAGHVDVLVARRAGKVLVIGSASALRGMKRASSYSAARGAQLAYAQAVGVEMAPHQIQVNAIAQNFVDNPTYFPPEVQANPRFQERMKWEVPLGRLVSAKEDAEFAAYLCSEAANCFVGQVFPVCGGWAPR